MGSPTIEKATYANNGRGLKPFILMYISADVNNVADKHRVTKKNNLIIISLSIIHICIQSCVVHGHRLWRTVTSCATPVMTQDTEPRAGLVVTLDMNSLETLFSSACLAESGMLLLPFVKVREQIYFTTIELN